MADRDIQNNKAEQMEASRESSNVSAMSTDLLQNNDLYRQLKQHDSSNPIEKNGFPDLMIEDKEAKGETAQFKSKFTDGKSPYSTGTELTTERELKQAGLNPKDVKHTSAPKDENGVTAESTTVKYPNGLEVTVHGRSKVSDHGNPVTMQPEVDIKLPKDLHRDKDDPNTILNKEGKKVAEINEDGTVSVKVGKDYVNQGPSGVREEEGVIESHRGKGKVTNIKVHE